jgi:hypothetical protein
MAVNLSPYGGVGAQFLDNSGNVLTGGKIFTYSAGTTTPQTTYTTSAGNIPHSNPIILDASGRVPSGGEIWLTDGSSYKFILRDSNDVLIATYDNVTGINSNFVAFTNQQEIQTATAGQTVFNLTTVTYQPATNSLTVFVDGVNQYGPGAQYAYFETDNDTVTFVNGLHVGAEVKFTTSQLNSNASQSDAFQVSYTPPFTNSVGTNVGDKLAQTVSVMDFGAVGDGVTDDSVAIQNAINSLSSGVVILPKGLTFVAFNLAMKSNVYLQSDNATLKLINNAAPIVPPFLPPLLRFTNVNNSGILGTLNIDGNKANQTQLDDLGAGGVHVQESSSNIFIDSLYIRNSAQDGLYIGVNTNASTNFPSNVFVKNLVVDGAVRTGLGITSGVYLTFDSVTIVNTGGGLIGHGVSIEPNISGAILHDIAFNNIFTTNNTHNGFQILGKTLDHKNIEVKNIQSNNNAIGITVEFCSFVTFLSGSCNTNGTGVFLPGNIRNFKMALDVHSNLGNGVNFDSTTATLNSTIIDFSGSNVFNNGTSNPGTFVGVRLEGNSSYPVTNVTMNNCNFYDNQSSPTQAYGYTSNLYANNVRFSGNLFGNTVANYSNGNFDISNYVEFNKVQLYRTLNFPSINAGAIYETTQTVTGAKFGATVIATPYSMIEFGLLWCCAVAATNSVTLRIFNTNSSPVDPASIEWNFVVINNKDFV